MNAAQLVTHLLDSDESRLKTGISLEKEHFRHGKQVDKTPEAIAKTHLKENPHYYPDRKPLPGEKEVLHYQSSTK
jgi:hypothetical protein